MADGSAAPVSAFESAIASAARLGAVEAWCEPPPDEKPYVTMRIEIPDELLGRTRAGWVCISMREGA